MGFIDLVNRYKEGGASLDAVVDYKTDVMRTRISRVCATQEVQIPGLRWGNVHVPLAECQNSIVEYENGEQLVRYISEYTWHAQRAVYGRFVPPQDNARLYHRVMNAVADWLLDDAYHDLVAAELVLLRVYCPDKGGKEWVL